MIKTENITNLLETSLNAIDKEFQFELFTELGKKDDYSTIGGVVKCTKEIPTDIADYIDFEYAYRCELAIPTMITGKYISKVKEVVDKFIKASNGKEIEIGGGKGIFTFSNVLAGEYKRENNYMPLSFEIKVKYTENSVTSKTKHWLLDGVEIPFKTESIILEKEGEVHKVNGESYTKTQLTGQTKLYKFTFPYDADNELCKTLQKDILNGDFEKTYKLRYYDGVIFTDFEPFETTVSIFRNADTSSELIKTSMFNITFTDVDSGSSGTKYYMALCDTVFDMNGENTRYFEATSTKTAKEVQTDYWLAKVAEGCDFEQIKAPNLNSIDITSQVYRNTRGYELFDLTNKNYAVIKIEKNGAPTKYYYYFVTNASIGANNQVIFDLKLDTIQSYFFDPNIEFGDCLINKAHINRWEDIGNGKVRFNGQVESILFEREDIHNVAKRLKKRTKLSLNSYWNTNIKNWLDENVICWVYIFADVKRPIIAYKEFLKEESETTYSPWATSIYTASNKSSISLHLATYCYPILKANKHLVISKDDFNIEISGNCQLSFGKDKDGESVGDTYVFAKKVSYVPPFWSGEWGSDGGNITSNGNVCILNATIKENNILALCSLNVIPTLYVASFEGINRCMKGLFSVVEQTSGLETNEYHLTNQFVFNKSDIVTSNKCSDFNPKLLGIDYCHLSIGDSTGDSYMYDIQKLNKQSVKFLLTEPLSPDISRCYIRAKNMEGYYIDDISNNFTGFVGSADNSLPLITTAYQQMISNNKNFYIQNSLNRDVALTQGLMAGALAMAGGAASKTTSGKAIGVVGGAAAIVNSGISYAKSKTEEALTVDNLKNAPSNLQNAKGNVFLNTMVVDQGVYVEEWDILPNEKEMINDYMDLYGFTYNRMGDIKELCNIRKYHNYIQADISSIIGSMSNVARQDIKERFQAGIRFWNNDIIQFNLENYEKWLEE